MTQRKRTYKKIQRGIFCYETTGGQKRYGIDIQVHPGRGGRIKKVVADNVELARQILAIEKAKIAQGKYEIKSNQKPPTFAEFVEVYMSQKRLKNKSPKRSEQILKRACKDFGDMPLDTITRRDIDAYFLGLSNEKTCYGRKPSANTLNRHMAVLRNLFYVAIQHDYVTKNPLARMEPFRADERPVRCLTREEEARLLLASDPALEPMIVISIHTGLRRGELLNLDWRDVDFDGGEILVRRSKTRTPRTIPLNSQVVKALRGLPGDRQGFVFPWARANITRFERMFRDAVRQARVPNFRWHDLRATFCTRLCRLGADVKTVMQLAGHSNVETTLKYLSTCNEVKRAAVNALARADLSGDATVTRHF